MGGSCAKSVQDPLHDVSTIKDMNLKAIKSGETIIESDERKDGTFAKPIPD